MARPRLACRIGTRPRLALGLIVLASGVLLARADDGEGRLADPLPIRRVSLPAGRLAAELKKAGEGVFRRLDRDEFERRVQDAARGATRADPPWLAEARYRAKLIDASAGQTPGLSGTAQWKVVHPGKGSALLRLEDGPAGMNFAIRNPRFDNRDAILTRFPEAGPDGSGLALLIDRPGEHTLTMDWSIRAGTRPEGLVVELRVPVSPAAELELELPVGRTLAVVARPGAADEAIVSGPHPADAADRRTWRVACGGRSHLPLLVRRTPAGSGEAVVTAWQDSVQKLSPDGLESATTFSIETLHQGVRDLVFALGPTLRPVGVVSADLEQWRVESAPGGSRIHVRLAQPVRKCAVEVRCLAPLLPTPAGRNPGKALVLPWSSPAIVLERAIPRGEALEIWLHPELRLLTWEPGDFRLVDSALVAEAEGKPRRRRLTLQGGGVGPAKGVPRRPGGTIQEGSVEYLVAQQLWWRPRADAMELTARLEYRVRQGQMFQIPLRLPQGWEVEGVELDPAEKLRAYDVRGGPESQTLIVALRRPLLPGAEGGPQDATGTLTVRLRPSRPGPWAGRDLPFPDVVPLGARGRSGGLAIDFDERLYEGHVRTTLPAGETPAAPALWGEAAPDHYYPFQGDSLRGAFRFGVRPPRSRASVRAEALLLPNRISVEARIRLEAEGGETSRVDLFVSGQEGAEGWEWSSPDSRPGGPRIRSVARRIEGDLGATLAAIGGGVLNRLTLDAARCRGASWRVEFDRPLRAREPLTLVGRTTRLRAGNDCAIPLVSVRDAASMAGDLRLTASGYEIVSKSSHAVRETGTRDYRWNSPYAWLAVRTRPSAVMRPAGATIDRACITSVLSLQGDLRHSVRLRVSGWGKSHLPIPLPPGAKLLAASADGRWLEPTAVLDGEGVARVPILAEPAVTRVELLYSTPADRFLVGCRLDAPLPDLPLAPVSFRRSWLLPPGVTPVAEGGLIPAGEDAGDPGNSVLGRLLRLLRIGPSRGALAPFGLDLEETSPADREQQALADAFAGLRKERGGQRVRLERVVEDLAGDLRGRCPVLVDRAALRRGGWSPDSRLLIRKPDEGEHATPWEEDGPVVLRCRGGVLLTTAAEARRRDYVRADASPGAADPSGRFVPALDWLAGPGTSPGLLEPDAGWDGWSRWAARAGRPDSGSVWVVRESAPAAGGVLLACVLGLLLLRRRASARPLLLAWLALSGVAALWLPSSLFDLAWLALIAGLIASLALYLAWASRPRKPGLPPSGLANKPAIEGASIAGACLALLLAPWGHAQRPEAATVYLLDAAPKGKASVLAPAALLERLEALARPADAATTKPVLLGGEVTGRVAEGRAEFTAAFVAQCFDEGAATLVLPLEGGQLVGDVLVDGVRVLPEARTKPVPGYAIRLRGRGRHKIDLRFQVAISAAAGVKGGDPSRKQVTFRLPPLPQSRLSFQLPDGASTPEIPASLGPARVVVEGKARRLEADLGAMTTPVQVRWNGEAASRPARVSVREAHLWDLRADASLLTTFLQYSIRDGAVGSLSVAIPDGLEVRSVQTRRPAKGVAGDFSGRLSNWGVSPSRPRMLRLEFPAPVGGDIDVTLQLVPRQAWSESVVLPIPRPRGVAADKGLGYLGFRTQGIEARPVEWLRINGIAVADFAPFWPAATRPAASALDYASTFSADAARDPELRLAMRPLPPRLRARQAVTVTVGPGLARWHARVDLTAREKNLSLAQWDIVPPKSLAISAVEGAGVSRWVQSGDRLTVWFEKTTDAARLEMTGWAPLDAPAPGRPAGQSWPRFVSPCLLPLGMPDTETTLALAGGDGLTLTPASLGHLRPDAPGAGLRYRATRPDYAGVFLVLPGPPVAAHLLTTARLAGREVVFVTDIRGKMPGGRRPLAVRMRGWEGDASLEVKAGTAAPPTERQSRRQGGRERLWSLVLSPDATGEFRLRIAGRVAVEDGGDGVALPDIALQGVPASRELVVEPSLIGEVGSGAVPLSGSEGDTRSWRMPDEATARVVPRAPPRPPAVRILFAEQRSRLAAGARWLHEYRCWVGHAGPAEAVLRWPEPVEVLSATVGPIDGPGRSLESAPEGDGVWRIPLPATGKAHAVVIRYRRPRGETPSRPALRAPLLEGEAPVRLLRTIDVPAGWRLPGLDRSAAGATRRALASLTRAAGRLEICRAGRAEFAEAYDQSRRRLDRHLRLAQVALDAGGDGSAPFGPEGRTLKGWLDGLKHAASALPRGADTGAIPPTPEDDDPGRPVSRLAEAWEVPPTWHLEPAQARETREAFILSAEWLAVLLIVSMISSSNFSRAVARQLWPEQLAALGLACWHLAGPGLPAAALVVLGVAGRATILLRGLRALSRRTPAAGTASRAKA